MEPNLRTSTLKEARVTRGRRLNGAELTCFPTAAADTQKGERVRQLERCTQATYQGSWWLACAAVMQATQPRNPRAEYKWCWKGSD